MGYGDTLVEHQVHSSIGALEHALDAISSDVVAQVEEQYPDVFTRARSVIATVRGLLEVADPQLVHLNVLDSMHNAFQNAATYVQSIADSGVGGTPNLLAAMDQILSNLAGLLVAAPASSEPAAAIAKRVGRATNEYVRELEAKVQSMEQVLESLRREAATNKEAIEAEDEARIAALSTRAQAISKTLEAEGTRVAQLVANSQESLTQSETETKTERAAAIAAINEDAATALEQIKERAEAVLQDAEDKRQRVESLYGVITDQSVSGAFGNEAAAQKAEADNWRRNALRLGLASAAIAVAAVVFATIDEDASDKAQAGGVLVAVLVAGLTAYAAKQSASHRAREVRARRLNLELAAFGPYLDNMDDPDETRSEYAKRLFRGGEEPDGHSGDHHTTAVQAVGEIVMKQITGRLNK